MRRFSEGPDFGLTMINHNLAELLAEAKRPASVAASGRDKRITMRLSRDAPLLFGLTGLMTSAALAANMALLTQEVGPPTTDWSCCLARRRRCSRQRKPLRNIRPLER